MVTNQASTSRRLRFVPPLAAGAILAITSIAFDVPFLAQMVSLGSIVAAIVAAIVLPGRPEIRSYAPAALSVLAVVAAGQMRGGVVFTACAVAFAAITIVCMRAGRGGVVRASQTRLLAVVLGVAMLVAIPIALALPPASRWVERRVFAMGRGGEGETGFSAHMRLGTTWTMLQSDTVVMRVYAKPGVSVDYLRGVVYDRYERREWTSSLDRTRRAIATPTVVDDADVRIVVARTAPVARWQEARWFLPADACDVATPSGAVDFDEGGIAHPDAKNWIIDPIGFRTKGCTSNRATMNAPSHEDLALPTKIHVKIGPIAEAWTKSATTDRERISAIVGELAKFEYSLSVRRNEESDPIVDFLTVHRAGYCEDFASALALLARAKGIPTRVVSGYRVHEESPIDGHFVVREKNAHTWVEAWVDGAWRAYDPTPISDAPEPRSKLAYLAESARAFADSVDRKTAALILAGAGVLFLVLRRAVRALRARVRPAKPTFTVEPALPPYVALESALERAGHARGASEPLEAFAARVGASDAAWAADVARAIRAYAAFRYGDVGASARIEGDLVASTEQITASSRARPAPAT